MGGKEYAETAMNELLGWYGYDKMNKGDTQALNLSLFGPSSKSVNKDVVKKEPLETCSTSSSSDEFHPARRARSPFHWRQREWRQREKSLSPSSANSAFLPAGYAACGWCQKVGPLKIFTFKMAAPGEKVFCSEVCFTHHRRANFKRSRTCDWCRHVRHTVNYVDLQDGDSQYQFCSDKCLNQFKLDIFCQEAKEHLEMHPYHQEQQQQQNPSSANLITPDLWLRNCVSPPHSDDQDEDGNDLEEDTIVSSPSSSSLKPGDSNRKFKSKNPPNKKKRAKKVQIHTKRELLNTPSCCLRMKVAKMQPPPNFFPNAAPATLGNPTPPPIPTQTTRTRNQASLQAPPVPDLLPIQRFPARSLIPPPTVLVPYPLAIPIPVPIPIPIPFPIFLEKKSPQNAAASEETGKADQNDEKIEEFQPVVTYKRYSSRPKQRKLNGKNGR